MATKRSHASHVGKAKDAGAELAPAVQALTQAAQALTTTTAQMMELLQSISSGARLGPGGGVPAAGASAVQVNTWEDDPFSELTPTTNPVVGTPVSVPAPVNNHPLLQTQMLDPAPPPASYSPGTANFRFWTAAEALARGINFWAPLLPAQTRWTTVNAPMRITLVAGQDLNANYTRVFGLRFFQRTVRNLQIFSGESPDIVCHELGHAILDALKPQLFNVASLEVSAFHEAFGDMSAILSSLQLDSVRQKVLQETQGHLNVNSRLSRLAEQLGWAIRQLSPTAVDGDCLRNAANRFFYRPPAQLPPSAPSTQLSSEFHSFSRVFTGAFLDALARMLPIAGTASSDNLLGVTKKLGQLLVDGVRLAPVTSAYYSQVAAAMIQADQTRNQGENRPALRSAFVQHGILSPSSVAALVGAPAPTLSSDSGGQAVTNGTGGNRQQLTLGGEEDDGYRRGAEDAPELPTVTLSGDYGVVLRVHVPAEGERFGVVPASFAGADDVPSPDQDASAFVEDLMQLGCIDLDTESGGVAAGVAATEATSRMRKTHALVPNGDGTFTLKRLYFDCGFAHCQCDR